MQHHVRLGENLVGMRNAALIANNIAQLVEIDAFDIKTTARKGVEVRNEFPFPMELECIGGAHKARRDWRRQGQMSAVLC